MTTEPTPPTSFSKPVRVKLVGTDGNAFAVLGLCRRAAKRAGVPAVELGAFTAEAQSGDYNALLVTCQRWCEVS
jgi:hypothetical protein